MCIRDRTLSLIICTPLYVTEIVPIVLKLANGQTMVAKKQVIFKVSCCYNESDSNITVEALIVYCLPYNLLSVQKINNTGYKVIFEGRCATVIRRNTPLFVCEVINSL